MAPTAFVIAGVSIVLLVMLLAFSPLFHHRIANLPKTYNLGYLREQPLALDDLHDRAMSSALTTAIIATVLGILLIIAVTLQLIE